MATTDEDLHRLQQAWKYTGQEARIAFWHWILDQMGVRGEGLLEFTSGVSAETGQGFVKLTWGEQHGQLTPAEARRHAFGILEAADAADSDSFLWRFLQQTVGLDDQRAARVLVEFRAYRDQQAPPDEATGEGGARNAEP
jgi:hypothetical protein